VLVKPHSRGAMQLADRAEAEGMHLFSFYKLCFCGGIENTSED